MDHEVFNYTEPVIHWHFINKHKKLCIIVSLKNTFLNLCSLFRFQISDSYFPKGKAVRIFSNLRRLFFFIKTFSSQSFSCWKEEYWIIKQIVLHFRKVVADLQKLIDPEGVEARKRKRLKQRSYCAKVRNTDILAITVIPLKCHPTCEFIKIETVCFILHLKVYL